ncbi:MAG: hypothetical protein P8I83_11495 [Paracoccaceae bacterium]|nr:hypothetical protein [Paracoccaceae bacterium]
MLENDSAINSALSCLTNCFVKTRAMAILSANPRPAVIPNRLADGKLLTSIYEKLIIKTLRNAKKLAIISALVIASHKKTAAKGKTSIRAKKLKAVAQETNKYIRDTNENPITK